MNDLINNLTSQLNIDNGQAKGGLGAIMKLAQSKLDSGEFGEISNVLGGAENTKELMKAAPAEESSGGMMGALGGITSALGANTGALGSLGALAGLASSFKSLNMDSDILKKFAPIVMNWISSNGNESVKGILKKFM